MQCDARPLGHGRGHSEHVAGERLESVVYQLAGGDDGERLVGSSGIRSRVGLSARWVLRGRRNGPPIAMLNASVCVEFSEVPEIADRPAMFVELDCRTSTDRTADSDGRRARLTGQRGARWSRGAVWHRTQRTVPAGSGDVCTGRHGCHLHG